MAGRRPKEKNIVLTYKKDKGWVRRDQGNTDPWVTIAMLPLPSGKPDRRLCLIFQCKRESIQRLTKEVKEMFGKGKYPDIQFPRLPPLRRKPVGRLRSTP